MGLNQLLVSFNTSVTLTTSNYIVTIPSELNISNHLLFLPHHSALPTYKTRSHMDLSAPMFSRPGRATPSSGRDSRLLVDLNRNPSCGHSKRHVRRMLSNEQRRYLVESWGDIVEHVPGKEATADDVRAWLLMVLHRRSHPDPGRVVDKLRWSGRDLHRASYLATRHRLRAEADGMIIAHDIHDAAKQSRKRAKRQKKGSKPRRLR
ncbi:hypothetical protein F4818DRAFT_411971 [Hypoxylon cercidicola]|nr:hypothetical protein F4818DRAFT_411971 [Hypoxylon cercidicola]